MKPTALTMIAGVMLTSFMVACQGPQQAASAQAPAAGKPAAPKPRSIVAEWTAANGDKVTFSPPGADGEGEVRGLLEATRYEVLWQADKRHFSLALGYSDDPGLPPTYTGRISDSGQELWLTTTHNPKLHVEPHVFTTHYKRTSSR